MRFRSIFGILALCALVCSSCAAKATKDPAFGAEGKTSAPSVGETVSERFVPGVYRGVDGGDAVLTLFEDGTFTLLIRTELSSLGEHAGNGVVFRVLKSGTVSDESGCALAIDAVAVSASGLEGEETARTCAKLLSEDDPEREELFFRVLSGETVDGTEFFGDDCANKVLPVALDPAGKAFSVRKE